MLQAKRFVVAGLALLAAITPLGAQRGRGGANQYTKVTAPVIALTNARVIDGTGAAAKPGQTIIIRDGNIAAIGPTGSTTVPEGAQTIDLTGKSVTPGFVMAHEHLYYINGPSAYGYEAESFVRLYLAGGVTSMRTTGDMTGYGDISVKRAIDAGTKVGPWIDVTGPYLTGPGLNMNQFHELKDADDARRMVNFWADAGATSFKAYMHITRDELRASIEEVHKRGLRITGHLCSVTFREAAELGIDNLEHGFFVSTDFFPNKQPDVCPGQGPGQQSVAALDLADPRLKSLIDFLVQKKVALTSTLPVFETFTPGRPIPPGIDVLTPQLKQQFEQNYARTQTSQNSVYSTLYKKAGAMELMFARAGGLLIAGTDPTGGGGVVPGYSNQREMELLVENGFTPLEAIKICTMNGATFLGIADRVGSITVGKQADLVIIAGDPSASIADIRNVETVFRKGIGYDPQLLINSVKGRVGIY